MSGLSDMWVLIGAAIGIIIFARWNRDHIYDQNLKNEKYKNALKDKSEAEFAVKQVQELIMLCKKGMYWEDLTHYKGEELDAEEHRKRWNHKSIFTTLVDRFRLNIYRLETKEDVKGWAAIFCYWALHENDQRDEGKDSRIFARYLIDNFFDDRYEYSAVFRNRALRDISTVRNRIEENEN